MGGGEGGGAARGAVRPATAAAIEALVVVAVAAASTVGPSGGAAGGGPASSSGWGCLHGRMLYPRGSAGGSGVCVLGGFSLLVSASPLRTSASARA